MKTQIVGIVSFYFITLVATTVVLASSSPTPVVTTTATVSRESPIGGTTNSTVEQKVEYTLPYPGILPTHPLYRLKLIRDWIMERLIVDPLRKTEFYVLQADKYLAMATVYAARNAASDAGSAARTGEVFMAKAYGAAHGAKNSGKIVPGHILDLFDRSTAKHVEILSALWQAAPESTKSAYAGALEAVKNIQLKLGNLR